MNCVKNEGSTSKLRPVTIVLMGLLVLSLSSSAAQVQSQPSYLVVHALNPEGVEIASIEGMAPYWVEIYDGETLIGYGAHNEETYNTPIAIAPGVHTIEAKFNGMTLEENVDLEPGDTTVVVFAFNRTERHTAIKNALDSQGSISWDITYTGWGGRNPSWGYFDFLVQWGTTSDYPPGHWFANGYSTSSSNHWHAEIRFTEFEPLASSSFINLLVDFHYLEIRDLIPATTEFNEWFVQGFWGGPEENISRLIVRQNLTYPYGTTHDITPDWNPVPTYFVESISLDETYCCIVGETYERPHGATVAHLTYHHLAEPPTEYFYYDIDTDLIWGDETFKFSSVPYNLTGTGIVYTEGHPPVASFTYSPENPVVGEEITFDASSSYDPDGEIESYDWDFGDGNSAQEEVVTHAYVEAGEYAVTLTVTDNDGLTDSNELSLEVKLIPVLLVHGWRGSPDDMLDLENWLQDPDHGAYPDGYVERFRYEAVYQSVVDSAYYLRCYVPLFKRRLGLGEDDRIDIVAHSMGGLVSRWYIEKLGGNEHVRKLIMLGTPNKGSWLANLAILRWWDIAVRDFRPFAQVYHDLNDGFSQPQTEYRVIAGTGDHSPFYLNIIPGVPGVPDILQNDFIVTVESARGPGFSLIGAPGDGHSQSVVNVNPLISTHLLGNESTFQKVLAILSSESSQQTSMSVQGQVISSSSPYTPTVSPHNAMISGILYPGETKSHTTPVDSTSGSASFTVFWLNDGTQGNFDLTLQKPDATVIDPVFAETDPDITFVGDALLGLFDLVTEYYIVQSPDPGAWTMKITPVNVPSSGKQYFITVFLGSNVALDLSTDKYFYDLNDPISITATLLDDTTPLTGASVTAEVQKPNEAVDNIALYDDGSHGDLQANDGVYFNTYTSTAMGGQYDIKVFASGTTADGTDFVREATTGVVLDSAIPIANAGPNQIVALGEDVVFDGSGSSDDDGIAVHLWDIDTLADSDSDGIADNDVDLVGVNPNLIGGYAVTGTHTVQLTVDDAAGNGPTTDTMTVTVQECIFGDFNCDCIVDVEDIMEVASRWRLGAANPDPDNDPITPNYETRFDLDKDGDIDIVDIMLVVVHWGEACE